MIQTLTEQPVTPKVAQPRPVAGPGQPARPRKPVRQWPHRMVPVVLVLLGALVLLYPVGATYYNNYIQHQFARQYGAQVESMSASGLQAQLTAARQYNATLPAGLLQDPWDAKNPAMTAASSAYQAQLNAFDAMARIRIPAINVDLPVYHGTSEEVLARGIGHLFGSALPVGGSGTHAVLTGHSSLANATMFDHLPQLRMGDRFSIDVYGQTLAYQVDQITVVLPDQLDNIRRVNGADYVTLVTCTPYAVNTHRLLVRGHRVPFQGDQTAEAAQATGFDWSVQSWMWPRLAGAGAALLLLAMMILGWVRSDRWHRRRRAQRARAEREAALEPQHDSTQHDPKHE